MFMAGTTLAYSACGSREPDSPHVTVRVLIIRPVLHQAPRGRVLEDFRGHVGVLVGEPEYPPDLRPTTPDCDFNCLQCAYPQI